MAEPLTDGEEAWLCGLGDDEEMVREWRGAFATIDDLRRQLKGRDDLIRHGQASKDDLNTRLTAALARAEEAREVHEIQREYLHAADARADQAEAALAEMGFAYDCLKAKVAGARREGWMAACDELPAGEALDGVNADTYGAAAILRTECPYPEPGTAPPGDTTGGDDEA